MLIPCDLAKSIIFFSYKAGTFFFDGKNSTSASIIDLNGLGGKNKNQEELKETRSVALFFPQKSYSKNEYFVELASLNPFFTELDKNYPRAFFLFELLDLRTNI